MIVTKTPLLEAVEKTAFRASLLLRAATHPERPAIGKWSVAETANHLSHCYPSFTDAFRGAFNAEKDEVDAHNDQVLADDPERNLDVLADRIEAGMPDYVEVAGGFAEDDPVDFFVGMRVPAFSITATLLGEVLVHGYDIARAEGLPWTIEPDHAILTLEHLAPVMEHFIDEQAVAGLDAAFEIRLRGGTPSFWYFEDDTLIVEDSKVRPIDCHISADPVTFLLMAYNRIGPVRPALSGKVLVWGGRPWLATRLGAVFKT